MVCVNKIDSGWNDDNVNDYERFTLDNADKVASGVEAFVAVAEKGDEIVIASCVRRLKQRGWSSAAVKAAFEEVIRMLPAALRRSKNEALEETTKAYALGGDSAAVVIIATVVYATAGVDVADAIILENERGGKS